METLRTNRIKKGRVILKLQGNEERYFLVLPCPVQCFGFCLGERFLPGVR